MTIPAPAASLRLLALPLVALALAVVAVVAGASPAHAHAVLQSTTPGDGSTVAAVPDEVTLQFNEPVEATLGAVRVFDEAGERVDAGDAGNVPEDPARLRVGMPDGLPDGMYVATWAAVSGDGHPVKGAFVFGVGEGAAADPSLVERIFASASPDDAPLNVTASILRAIVYAGALLAVGGAIFLLAVHDRNAAERPALVRVAAAGAVVAAVASLLGVAVQGALLAGFGPGGLVDPRVFSAALGSSFGMAAAVRVAGLVVLLVALPRLWSRPAVAGSVAGGTAVIASFALTGHAATTEPRWLVIGADLAHTLAGAAWAGGLVLLLVALRRRRAADDPRGGGRMVARFSTLATGAVLLVAVAGSGLAWAQVRAVRALTETAYGWTLVGKVAVVAAIVAVAAYNQRRLVPAITRGSGDAWSRLRRTVRLEVVGLVAVVAITGFLTNLQPARVEAGVTGAFSEYVDFGEDHTLNVTVDPNRAGSNEVHIYLLGPDGRPAGDAQDLTLGMSLPANELGPIERAPEIAGPGHWLHSGPELAISGDWTLEVTARIGEFEQVSADVALPVNP